MTNESGCLALHGGAPVRRDMLPYGRQTVTAEDIAAVVDVLQSDWITTGPKIEEFEETLAATVGATYAVCFSSGTAALHGAAFAAGLGAGDEAITTPLTFCATANCVLYQGATPVFADVRADTLTLDPDAAAARVTPRTRALLPVDYAGTPADLDAFLELAGRHRLVVIEDAAHALGAEYRSRLVGSICHMSTFSFHPVKHLTTGEGGAVTTNDPALAARLRVFRNHGIDSGPRERQAAHIWRYDMTALGYNYRLSDIACALGISQLSRLPANLQRRRSIAAQYSRGLADVPFLELPVAAPDVNPAWHLYPVRVRPPISRDEVWRALRAEGLGVSVHYPPVHLHSYYRSLFASREGDYPEAELASRQLISLPMFHGMTAGDVADVITAVRKVFAHFAQQTTS
jgi:perosamine synthetase